jgi:hypothetical protein
MADPKQKSRRRFVDRVEDNDIAVLLGDNGERENVPGRGLREGMVLPDGFYGAPGADPASAKRIEALRAKLGAGDPGGPIDLMKDVKGGRMMDPGKGAYLDNHEPASPATIYAGQQSGQRFPDLQLFGSPMPAPPVMPFRLPSDQAGPMPPGGPTVMMPPGAAERSNADDYYGGDPKKEVPMPSSRGRTKNRRRRAVP